MTIVDFEPEKQERIKMLATLNYWHLIKDIEAALDWMVLKGFLTALECNEVFKETIRMEKADIKANDNWRECNERPLFKQGVMYGI